MVSEVKKVLSGGRLRIVPDLGAVVLGAVLLVAAAAKAWEPGAFLEQVRLEGLDFLLPGAVVVVLALALEVGLGVALLLAGRHALTLIPSALLVVFFLFLTGRNYWLVARGERDPEAACGCFGSLVERTAAAAFWQDLFLLIPPLMVAFIGWRRQRLPRFRLAAGLVAALLMAGFTASSQELHFAAVANEIASLETDRSFHLSTGYQLRVGDRSAPGARIYQSEGSVELLVIGGQLPPLLIDPVSERYFFLEETAVRQEADRMRISDGEERRDGGSFSIESGGIVFTIEGKEYLLRPTDSGPASSE